MLKQKLAKIFYDHYDTTMLLEQEVDIIDKIANSLPPDYFQDIIDFHQKFQVSPSPMPSLLPVELEMFRYNFMIEELTEYRKAYKDGNLHDAFDALIDLVYVALGTAYLMNLPFDQGWSTVHDANMKKERTYDATKSKRNSAFDVIKPPAWKAPDHTAALKQRVQEIRDKKLSMLQAQGSDDEGLA